MNKLETMLTLTKDRIPWALARFNDGEMKAMCRAEGFVARGDQPCTPDLRASLTWAMGQRAGNLFIGVPCRTCWPKWRFEADKRTAGLRLLKPLAVVLTNRNLKAFKEGMPPLLKDRTVWWISGEDQAVIPNLPFKVETHLKLPLKDAYTKSWGAVREIRWGGGEVVFLSCGPLATVAAVHLFMENPLTTFIDVGSVWDPETRGVSHSCHTGKLKPCKECN